MQFGAARQAIRTARNWVQDRFLDFRAPFIQHIGRETVRRSSAGRCLVSYVPEAIRAVCKYHSVNPEQLTVGMLRNSRARLECDFPYHSMYWETTELVAQLLERNLVVDYCFRRLPNEKTQIQHYDFIIDEWSDLPRWKYINPQAKYLFYATGMEWSAWNLSELRRVEWLFHRRGFCVPHHRQLPPILSSEDADLISSFGNQFINDTFSQRYQHKIRRLALSVVHENIPPVSRNWTQAKTHFLWYAGYDWLSRGLDILIEIFDKRRDLQLHIVGGGGGGVQSDPHFIKYYLPTVQAAPNIRIYGKLDPGSESFRQLVSQCAAVVVPTALDSCSGSVLQAMHLGLLPVTTETAGLDLPKEFSLLDDQSCPALFESIENQLDRVAASSPGELASMSESARAYANQNHTKQRYCESLETLLGSWIS